MPVPCCAAILLPFILAGSALAQPPLTPNPIEPAAEADPARRAQEAAALYTLLSRGYATRRIEERITIAVRQPGDHRTTSEVTWRFLPGSPAQRIIRTDLGPLQIYAAGSRLIAAHAQNDGIYFEAELPAGLTAAALRAVLPPLPFPQAVWALSDPDSPDATSIGGLAQVLAETSWSDLTILDSGPCDVRLTGAHPAGPVVATASRAALPWAPVCSWEMPAAPDSPLRLEFTCERLAESNPAAWPISTDGRVRVNSLSDLKPLDPPIALGQRVPMLGLMSADLGGWSLSDAMASSHDGPLNQANGDRPVDTFAVLILLRPATPNAPAVAEAARAAAVELRKDLDRRRHMGRTTLPRCFVRVANVVTLADISDPTGERALAAGQPLPTSEPSTIPLFTAGGIPLIDSFVRGASLVVAVIGPEERLAAAIPIDPAMPFDRAAFTNRLKQAVVGVHDSDLIETLPEESK